MIMETLCTSVIPIKFSDAILAKRFVSDCAENGFLHPYASYAGIVNLTSIKDITTNSFDFYFIPSSQTDIQCVCCESTLILVLTWEKNYDDYYCMVNEQLKKKNVVVKNVLSFYSGDELLRQFLAQLKGYCERGEANVFYAFTYYSILDKAFSDEDVVHVKVLAEPSVIQMDDMQCSDIADMEYHAETVLNDRIIDSINDIDFYTEQQTYVTWASVVTVSKKRDVFINNHVTLTLLEIHVQRIWNLCYSQSAELNKVITGINNKNTDVSKVITDTYRILLESKNHVSATYSSRVSALYKAIVESSQLEKNIDDLEQKLNYLIVLTNTINQQKNRSVQESSEIVLFLIAIAQVIPIFFDLPLMTHYVFSIITVVLLCVVGVVLIRIKYRR